MSLNLTPMCTMIVKQVTVDGSGKGTSGWFDVQRANVSYDHPYGMSAEHALNIDFVNEAQGRRAGGGGTQRRIGAGFGEHDSGGVSASRSGRLYS